MLRQLCMASGYLAIYLMPALLCAGLWMGEPSLAFAAVMLVFPLTRLVFGGYRPTTVLWSEPVATALDEVPVIYGAVLLVAVIATLFMLHAGAVRTIPRAVGLGLSLWMTMFFATCPAHELIHRRSRFDARIGRLIAGVAGYPILGREHLIHHARSGDTRGAEWPRLDESVWGFAARRIRLLVGDASAAEGLWQPASRSGLAAGKVRGACAVTLLTWLAFTVAGGLTGFIIYLGTIVGVTFGVQLITYLQHWGLGDDQLSDATSQQYGWEDDCLFQAWITLHISFHQAHHHESRTPFYRLALMPDSPRHPSGYVVLMVLCLFPNAWRRLMLPALKHWREQPQQPRSPGRRLSCFALYG